MLTLLEENVQSVHILTGCLWCVGKRGWGGGGRGDCRLGGTSNT